MQSVFPRHKSVDAAPQKRKRKWPARGCRCVCLHAVHRFAVSPHKPVRLSVSLKRPGHDTLMHLCVFKQQWKQEVDPVLYCGRWRGRRSHTRFTFSCHPSPRHSLSSLLPPLHRAHPSFHISSRRVLLELDSLRGGKFLLSASARCRVCRSVHMCVCVCVEIIPLAFFDWLGTNLCFGLCRWLCFCRVFFCSVSLSFLKVVPIKTETQRLYHNISESGISENSLGTLYKGRLIALHLHVRTVLKCAVTH